MNLSIAMIVKNEERILERTLKSIRKLDGQITYEIVIVDTGSTDNTLKIAKKYAHRVYEHKWTGNFGEMRNLSIKYCKGDWILVLDADEVLENPQEVVNFFKKGDNKKYNSLEINFKNFTSDNENEYFLGTLYRLFRNHKDFCYVGRVHEQPKVYPPVAKSRIRVLHYGYSREDYELMRYKYERNKKLLLIDIANNVEPIYSRFQLAQTYSMANEHALALDLIKEAYNMCNEEGLGLTYLKVNVYHFYVKELISNGIYEKAIEIAKQITKDYKDGLDFYYAMGCAYSGLLNYKEAYENFEEYIKLRNKREKGIFPEITLIEYSYCRLNEVIRNMIICLYKQEKFNDVVNMYRENKEIDGIEKLEEIYLYSMIVTEKYKDIREFYSREMKDDSVEIIHNILRKVDLNYSDNNIKQIANELLGIDEKLDVYLKTCILEEEVNGISIDLNPFLYWKADCVKNQLINKKISLEVFVGMDNEISAQYFAYMGSNYDCIKLLYEFSKRNFLSTDINKLVLVYTIEKILIYNNSIEKSRYNELIDRARANCQLLIDMTYNCKMINREDNYKFLDKYNVMWNEINKIIKNANNNKVYYLKELKKLLDKVPQYNKIIDHFKKKINSEPISEQMINEKNKLIYVIEDCLQNNRIDEAIETIDELNKIFIYDKKLYENKGIALFFRNEIEDALVNLSIGYLQEDDKFETAYNIGLCMQKLDRKEDAKYFYTIALETSKGNDTKEIKSLLRGI